MRDKKSEYVINYAKENLKRVPLDIQKDKYEQIKAAAIKNGESVNGYIKMAIDLRMKLDEGLNIDDHISKIVKNRIEKISVE